MAHKLMKSAIGAALTAMVLFAPSTFAETSTSPSGEVMGVSEEEENAVGSLRVRVNAGDSENPVELRFALKNSEDEFAEFEESDNAGVYRISDWVNAETDKTVLTVVSDTFEVVGLPRGDYKLIPLDKDFTVENGGEQQDYILVGAGEYEFTISPAENSAEDDSAESFDEAGQPAEIAEVELDYASKSLALPDTGGIGTGVFYIVGGTMIAVSATMLISRFKNRKK